MGVNERLYFGCHGPFRDRGLRYGHGVDHDRPVKVVGNGRL